MLRLPRIHIEHEQGNSGFAKLALDNEKAVTQPVEGGTGIIADQCYTVCIELQDFRKLTVCFKKIFLLKNSSTKVCVFGAVYGAGKQESNFATNQRSHGFKLNKN